jgi:spermidine synthase
LAAVLFGGAVPRQRLIAIALLGSTFAGLVLLPRDKLARLLSEERGGELLFYDEAASGTVAVLEQAAAGGSFRRLYIQGVSNTGDAMPSLRYMRLQALIPLLTAPAPPRAALVIGLGTGITCGTLATVSSLERRTCIELSPAVKIAASHFRGNLGVLYDRRFDIRIDDGRHALLAGNDRYDLITLEPPPPAAAGVVNLYSRDFYELAKRRLGQHGVLAQWWPLPTQNEEDSRSLVRSFLDAFAHVTLWSTELHEMLLVGSEAPLALELTRLQARFEEPAVARVLDEVGVQSVAALLATYVTDRRGLEAFVAAAPAVTDDDPRIEYSPWVRPGELTRVLPKLLALDGALPFSESARDAGTELAVLAERETLRAFYAGSLAAMRGDRDEWARAMQSVRPFAGSNPYYAWFLGGTAAVSGP